MKPAIIAFSLTLVAAVAAHLVATYLINNVRAVRRGVGTL